MSIQLKYKKLKYEIKYLTAEKDEVLTLLKQVLPKFEKEFKKIVPEFEQTNKKVKIKNNTNKKSKDKISNEKRQTKNKDVKKVYRRIVTRTHPDKLEQLPNTQLKKGLIKKYKEAVNSYRENDIVSLFDLADELDIKLPEIDESHIAMMTKQSDALKREISAYRNSNALIWHNSENQEETMNQIIEKLKQAGRI
tara:strand:- start:27 stop:608 length:582 start_codon:yes stop_codon:yes gene_type:complete